jgi:antitoxin CptB
MNAVEGGQGRLRWRCRRGMKELDLLLLCYLRERWPAASPAEKVQFELFLDLPDPDLVAYLLAHEPAADPALEDLLCALRGAVAPLVRTPR